MALKAAPKKMRTGVLEQWLNTLDDETRAEAIQYMRDTDYGPVSLARAFRHDGYRGSDKPIAAWRDKHNIG